ncbi:unnamed protein product [Nezara viridula]|uniref:Uncharacterized protein n=1 Tax=Nezara viridula TaxID=85310 RepID=A0A9P0E979_NEZVI|nr:unnamed protein product [Nezara viridula]
MEDSKHLAEPSKESLPDDDDVICISDGRTPFSEEVQDMSLSVTSYNIWIDEKASFNFSSSSLEGNNGWMENHAVTEENLKDPLCVEGYCEENKTVTTTSLPLVTPSCTEGSCVIDLTNDEDNSIVFDDFSMRKLDNTTENNPTNYSRPVSDEIKILFKDSCALSADKDKINIYQQLFHYPRCAFKTCRLKRIFSHIKYYHILNGRYDCRFCWYRMSTVAYHPHRGHF